MEKKKIPEVKGMKVEEVKEILHDNKLKYIEETKKKVDLTIPTGKVIKLEEEDKGIRIYESNRKLVVFPVIALILLMGITTSFGNGIFKSIQEQIIDVTKSEKISAPEVSYEKGWKKVHLIKIIKDSVSTNTLSYYEYCIEEDGKCEWEKTYTKNIEVSKTGKQKVKIRGVDEKGNKGDIIEIEVLVDNANPIVNKLNVIEVTSNSIKVKTEANDEHSGIEKYTYSLDGKNYVEGTEENLFKELTEDTEYEIYAKVIDKAGNEIIIDTKARTLKKDETKENEETKTDKKEWDIPEISLEDVPSVIKYKESYKLPSWVKFENDTGTYECKLNGEKVITNTNEIGPGTNTVVCTATSSHNKNATVEKKIKVELEVGEDEVWDGWIKLNLYYPEDSYNWEWRYGLEDVEDDESDWEPYTGPILVKIEDLDKIYIRYDIDGIPTIVVPDGKLIVDIEPDTKKVQEGTTTKVKIVYDEKATLKKYRINNGKWENYQGEFDAAPNDVIEAKAEGKIPVYNSIGEKVYDKTINGYDKKTLGIIRNPKIRDVIINLSYLPEKIYEGNDYSLPSYYSYGTHGVGTLECKEQNGNVLINTKYLSTGNYEINCEIIAQDGTKKTASKNIEVLANEETERNVGISLSGVPGTIVEGDNYNLPSAYTYGTHGRGTVECKEGTTILTETSGLELGSHEITCEVRAQDGTQASTTRTINVTDGVNPSIDMYDIPDTIYLGENYFLPSHYDFGIPANGTIECKDNDGSIYTTTGQLGLGEHEITCEIENGVGRKANASKRIEVIKRTLKSVRLAGPNIEHTPTTPVDNVSGVEVIITTPTEARTIYYRIGNGKKEVYNEPFSIKTNCIIYAWYETTDGVTTSTSIHEIDNIKEPNLPWVYIRTNPNYLSTNVNKVDVTIGGSDYDMLEYSYDDINYIPYQVGEVIEITETKTIYARGINANGISTPVSKTITTINPPAPQPDNIDISISLNPSGRRYNQTLNKTEVTITYDEKATVKKYSLDGKKTWIDYDTTGPFKVKRNTTVWAYATGDNAQGSAYKQIDFLSEGMPDPIINITPSYPTRAYEVDVTIDYDDTATIKKYKIISADGTDSGWKIYKGTFKITENNVKIIAYQEDENEYRSNEIEEEIVNIIPRPEYEKMDLGDYYLIKLNYPATSTGTANEYKWKTDGVWKQYDSHGILLIKQEEVHKYDLTKDGMEVVDTKGNTIIIPMDHVYVLDVPAYELQENLFMRWDTTRPAGPEIVIDTDEDNPVREVEVTITYPRKLIDKYYKLVHSDGTETDWLKYEGTFKIYENNTTIYAKGYNALEIQSEVTSYTVTNIDKIAPTIDISGDFETPKQKVNLTVETEDNKMLYMVKYAKGTHNADYFNENKEAQGTTIKPSIGTITINENGIYTFYVVDQAGNETLKEIKITNIDLNGPDIIINILSIAQLQSKVSVDYGDSTVKQYKIGTNGTYQTYNGTITINAASVHSLKNADGTITIYAKGTDSAGNVEVVSEKIYGLDLDMPATPVITATANYPTLTKYGIIISSTINVAFDPRTDITNYISLDNGGTWKVYTGNESVASGTVKVKSVKNSSGLTTPIASATVNQASDALGINAYDGNDDTLVSNGTYYLNIDSAAIGETISYTYKRCSGWGGNQMSFIDASNNVISSHFPGISTCGKTTETVKIPAKAKRMQINLSGELYEVKIITIKKTFHYPKLTTTGVLPGYYSILVNDDDSILTEYKIGNGSWKEYTGEVRLEIGQTIYARGIDNNGRTIQQVNFTANLPESSLNPIAYDGDYESNYALTKYGSGEKEQFILVDSALWNKKIKLKFYLPYGITIKIKYYNSSGNLLDTDSYEITSYYMGMNQLFTQQYTIRNNTAKIGIWADSGGNGGVTLYEFALVNNISSSTPLSQSLTESEQKEVETQTTATAVAASIDTPMIKVNKTANTRSVTIDYTPGYRNEYSLDLGITWIEYTESFTIEENTTIIARHLDGEKVVSSSTYQITSIEELTPTNIEEAKDEEESEVKENQEEQVDKQEVTTPVVTPSETTNVEENKETEEKVGEDDE